MLLKWLLLGSRYHFNCLFTGWHWVNHKTCPGGASTARGWVTALDFLKILCLFWDWTHFVFPKGAFDISTSNCAVVKESLCARHPRHLLWHLLTHLAGGRQSWEGPTVIRSQPSTCLGKEPFADCMMGSSLPPDCGDKLLAAKLKCGSNGLQTGGHWHLR